MSDDAAVDVRPRTDDDLPVLAELLAAQQPASRYPYRWPLPFPVADFLHARDARTAWTAVRGDVVVGHACLASPRTGADLTALCAAELGCAVAEVTWISSLFVAAGERRRGTGRLLLTAAVDGARQRGLQPCLEVLPVHAGALALYESAGWREVARTHPEWLPAHEPDVRVMVAPG